MLAALAVAAAAAGALFAPGPSCEPLTYAVVTDLNRLFPAATHGLPVHCSPGNGSAALYTTGVELECADQADCASALTAFVAGGRYPSAATAIAAAGNAVGSPTVECAESADCGHPFVHCTPLASLPGVGYCEPNGTVSVAKPVCSAGLHASCEELYYGVGGYALGLLLEYAEVLSVFG